MYNTKKGFTLIELLIVIAVIGILAGIVLAVINPVQQRERAQEATGRSFLGKTCTALIGCINASTTGTCSTVANEITAAALPTGVTWTAALPGSVTTANNIAVEVHTTCTLTCSLATGTITRSASGCITN